MLNAGTYNGLTYNGIPNTTGFFTLHIKTRYITSNLPHSAPLSTILPEINISGIALIEISQHDKIQMEKDFRDIMKEFE